MAGLKELRGRIAAIKSTEKITSAMKLVAASRLRKAQDVLSKSSAYRQNVYDIATRIMVNLRAKARENETAVIPTGICASKEVQQRYLLVVLSSDKGLCGSYNATIGRTAMARIEELKAQGKQVQIICLGHRGYNLLKRHYADLIIRNDESVVNQGVEYYEAENLAREIESLFKSDKIDVCEIVYSRFRSALNRTVVSERVLPFDLSKIETGVTNREGDAFYDSEPNDDLLLATVVPMAFREFVFDIMINSQASEQGARMTSMDNATRNAGDMIAKLTLRYNRLRQSAITTELTEIIAGAEAI